MVWKRSRSLRFSSAFISREAMQMSVVPLIRAAIPVPDPPPVTCTTFPGLRPMYCSAQRCMRITIVSEPLTVMPRAACAGVCQARSASSGATRRMNRMCCLLELVLELDRPEIVFGIIEVASADGGVGLGDVVCGGDAREAVEEVVEAEAHPLELVVVDVDVGIECFHPSRELPLLSEVLHPHRVPAGEVGGEMRWVGPGAQQRDGIGRGGRHHQGPGRVGIEVLAAIELAAQR